MKKVIGLTILLVVAVLLVGCSSETYNEEGKTIGISVYDNEGVLVYENSLVTNETNLLELLRAIPELELETESSQFGEFITSIKSITQENNYFWNYYINGEYATVGVSSYRLRDNDKIEFRLLRFE